jgi:fermentation-respiration switch protein FrsA (DUF1100 family)
MILVFLTAGGGLLLVLSLLENEFLFHPSTIIDLTPSDLSIPSVDLRIPTPDGVTLSGWLLPVPGAVATILLMHGNAGNVSHRLHNAAHLRREGFSIVLVDYRGYGLSTGAPSEAGIFIDARAVWDEMTLRRGLRPETILLYGESIGSAPSLGLALDLQRSKERGPAGIVIEGGLTSAREMASRIFPFLPVAWVMRARLDNLSAVREIRAPILFIHGTSDEIVPFAMGKRLYDAAVSPEKEMLEVPGAQHNSIWRTAGATVAARVRAFAEKCLRLESVAGAI